MTVKELYDGIGYALKEDKDLGSFYLSDVERHILGNEVIILKFEATDRQTKYRYFAVTYETIAKAKQQE